MTNTYMSYQEFCVQYPDEDSLLRKIFEMRYPFTECPVCGNRKPYQKIKGRRGFQCSKGRCNQIFPLSQSPLRATKLDIRTWIYVINWFVNSKTGLTAQDIHRILPITATTSSYNNPTHTFPNGTDSFIVTFITKKYGVVYTDCNRSIAIHNLVAGCKGGNGSTNPNEGSTGLDNLSNDYGLKIYPNPTTDKIHIDCKGLILTSILSLDGKLLFQTKANDIDLSEFNSGIYLLKIETEKAIIFKKVLKVK